MKQLKLKNILYLTAALGMLIYAIPRLVFMDQVESLQTLFNVVWLLFALLIISAHLHELFGVDQETRDELDRIAKMRKRRQFQRSR
ncbi:hypothetical protein E0485_18175 [Paenibacillus albiflavus]|uniref:Uncharacterized protein n=1 Tax=Paenibacillus albiflavus TaxID=2545760 RepID=A0A4R4E6J4_9BACL|nr:hypothetical protein [Paenibacillus albiflavus]TCZ75316.1 hypothetical protein E0485_18175 [Paenibacillus albiflavus]